MMISISLGRAALARGREQFIFPSIFLPLFFSIFLLLALAPLSSCKTLPPEPMYVSRSLTGEGVISAERLAAFLRENNPAVSSDDALYLARCYITEARDEGINSDVAFAQMCLETGYLKFGGLVTADMHNYCGLGAIDEAHRGETFPTVQLGVRAHIQHLNAYGDTDELNHPLIDKRAKWVQPRGKAPTVFELSGTWAADKNYGAKLDGILTRMAQISY